MGAEFLYSIHPTKFTGDNGWAYADGWTTWKNRTFEAFALSVCETVWSPCLWRSNDGITSVRKRENFVSSCMCVLDFDGNRDIYEAEEKFRCYAHVIAPTRSHMVDDKHHFRVVLFFERYIEDARQFEYNMKHYIDFFGSDPAAKDAARMYYPSLCVFSHSSGKKLEILDVPKLPKPHKAVVNKVTGEKEPTHAMTLFESWGAYTEGQRNETIFKVALHRAYRDYTLNDTVDYCLMHTSLTRIEVERTVKSAYKRAGKF